MIKSNNVVIIAACLLMMTSSPVNAANPTIVSISSGGGHSVALLSDHTIWAWGNNAWGQLGDGTIDNNGLPRPLLEGDHVLSIFAGSLVSGMIKDNNSIWIWGEDVNSMLNHSQHNPCPAPVKINVNDVSRIAYSGYEVTVLNKDGTVWVWGYNSDGRLGIGNDTSMTAPVKVNGLPSIMEIADSGTHTLALDHQGNVWAWGSNDMGQLGDGTQINRNYPVRSDISNVKAIAVGNSHSYALKNDGTVWVWGKSGLETALTNAVHLDINDVNAIAAGATHLLIIKNDGSLWAIGENMDGELGLGYYGEPIDKPVKVPGFDKVKAIAAGDRYSLALKEDGSLWAWGNNLFGQLGDGTISTEKPYLKLDPVRVSFDPSLIRPTITATPHATPTSTPTDIPSERITPAPTAIPNQSGLPGTITPSPTAQLPTGTPIPLPSQTSGFDFTAILAMISLSLVGSLANSRIRK